ncbi:Gpi ethanolamine phosphate transferase [Thalictrum thalictroides]|uniref:Gpi ethanolamine phosphate transferase n=1 Tax=Thalictrum thalictroides TaxID=46969 RepID=A0A7J6UYM2_THATH|nr:Gpi ethanolamine phosphate transferase [Thalictrum thalictroides]
MASQEGSSATIFKAIADPPTTSLQRLKGLTTGGLPTFIDVGNSFGAPAIVEDNLLYQLVRNGKRVWMMGDDTWVQLFPDHFNKSFPFPSFNVKDLDTVDDGCVQHLFPSLYEEEWDVLIAHFLGVDHAGHIFGVDSMPMIEKLEQYNVILEKVMDILKNQSGPGGLHENTLLLVMGDHGQTENGDHGGGTSEEVETSLFAMSLKNPPASASSRHNTSRMFDDGNKVRVSSMQQLDFAVTVAALLGVPFPFGSIGRVNPELYALTAGTWNQPQTGVTSCKSQTSLEEWMQNYANVLCTNSWQVKRYIDIYSKSSVIGFPSEDLVHLEKLYSQAQDDWLRIQKELLSGNKSTNGSCYTSLNDLQRQIDAYSNFLASVTELARSKWTEFDLMMMGIGLGILLLSLFIHLVVIKRANKLQELTYPSIVETQFSLRFISALFVVAIRASSFLSNSYILTEGKVASYLLGTTGIISLRYSILRKKMPIEAFAFLLLLLTLRLTTESGLSKQTVGSLLMNTFSLNVFGINDNHPIWIVIPEVLPILSLIVLATLLYKTTAGNYCWRFLKYFLTVAICFSYLLIAVHWILESNMLATPPLLQGIGRSFIPRTIYAIGFGLLVLLTVAKFLDKDMAVSYTESILIKTVAMLSAWSSTVMLIMGRQGPFIVLASAIGGWCIIRLGISEKKTKDGSVGVSATDPLPVIQWSFLAVCLFFYSGHWCAFDGLRYGAAFTGFDEFNLVRQAIILFIDTFGVSHILPILGAPLLVVFNYPKRLNFRERSGLLVNLSQVLLIYGLITSITTAITMICVTIQRRHLMVWGLFAPKFVFDVVGLVLTDVLICFSSIYYFPRVVSDRQQDQTSAK